MNKLWKQITPSDFAWEREALTFLRKELPDHEPYRAWANFEFIAQDGSINEVDLLAITPKGIFLVEIKSHPGEIAGDAGSWIWNYQGRRKAFDNPRILADRKAKKLASLLRSQRSARNKTIPFISTLVFLSAENVINKLQGPARQQVCTRKNVLDELIKTDQYWRHKRLDRPASKLVSRAIEEAGIKESLRSRRVGLYELTELLDEADHFQDWLATHSETQLKRRIRIYLTHGKSPEEAATLQKAAQLEFRLLEGIEHPGILHARDYQQHEQGPALVFEHDENAVRLDHFMTSQLVDMQEALNLTRQLVEAVKFAHGKRLYHRTLSPQSIYVTDNGGGQFSVKIGNWSTAKQMLETETRQLTVISHLSCLIQEEASPYLALEAHSVADSDAVYLDVFSLGTIAYLLFTGKSPAQDGLELQDKLSTGVGLQISNELNGAGRNLQDLIQYSTHPDTSVRIDSVDEFMERLYEVEDELTRPDHHLANNPTEATPGNVFDGGIVVKKRLGRGATSIAFVVEHKGQERALKLAATIEQNQQLSDEGKTLQKLRHSSIIAYHETENILGHTGLMIDYANAGTLAQRLRKEGAIQLELLERFGDDLLGAVCHLEDKGISHRDIKPENIGLVKQNRLNLVLFDFSLSTVSPDNYRAGTVAYMDPFIRDAGRRRWDDYAERFSVALTLYEMATGTLPTWANGEGIPLLLDGELEVDQTVFDPSIREVMVAFFHKALKRDIKQRFGNAEDMHRAWKQLFLQAPQKQEEDEKCPLDEAEMTTQVGLLDLSAQALDTLSRININTVKDLIRLPRNELVRMTGVGTKTRKELSEIVAKLQERLETPAVVQPLPVNDNLLISVDQLFAIAMPRTNKGSDPVRVAFINEYLGRMDSAPPKGENNVHWPTLVGLSAEIGVETVLAREIQARLLTAWGKNKYITQLRHDIAQSLDENGGLMTAIELSESVLLRRGSVQESPRRERYAQAVVRAAVETELNRQQSRWVLRRTGKRILIADNTQERGEELADYAEALGQLAEECAQQQPLLSPVRALERIRAVPAPESFASLSNHRLLRLAVAASQGAALSSRAEFYPQSMSAKRSIELGQGALLGARALTVEEVQARIKGRYPEAEVLPGRPQLDDLMQSLELGFQWDGTFKQLNKNAQGAYCLPQAGLTSASSVKSTYFSTQCGSYDDPITVREIEQFIQVVSNTIDTARFLALTVQPRQYLRVKAQLQRLFPVRVLGFDELLLKELHRLCAGMAKPPKWEVILKADAAEPSSRDWSRLQMLVKKALPPIKAEIQNSDCAVLLTESGLIGRYGLVGHWLSELRESLVDSSSAQALILLTVSDVVTEGAVIEGVSVPGGVGSKEFAQVPAAWLTHAEQDAESLENNRNNPVQAAPKTGSLRS